MPQHPGGVCNGILVPLPPPALLGLTQYGFTDRGVLCNTLQGLLLSDPEGPDISHNIQRGHICVTPTLGHCGVNGGGGSRTWHS